MNLPKKPGKASRGPHPAGQHKTPVAPPVYKPESSIQRSKKQRDIRAAKIYSGQHGGMWYPSGSSGVSDKVSAELGITAHELFSGPSGTKTKEEILAYWAKYRYLTKSQLAARYYITVDELDKIIA